MFAEGAQHSLGVPPPAKHRRLLTLLSQDGGGHEPLEHHGEHAVEAQRGLLDAVVVRLEGQTGPVKVHAPQMDDELNMPVLLFK